MYQSLYIGNREGGIINTITQADQQGAPVVVIGLGGTGVDAISQLKTKLRKQIKPDNYVAIQNGQETEPKYANIKFLGIDADNDWLEASGLTNDEQFNIQNQDFRAIFSSEKLPALKVKDNLNWMSIDYVSKHLPPDSNGAGATRQFARWLVINQSVKLRNKIENVINNACIRKKGGDLIVHIVSGISGGMGAGSFVDICYITRDILKRLGHAGALIYGYFILPDAVISKNGICTNEVKKNNNKKNGVASLLEIEHLMNLKDSKEWFEQDYDSFQIKTQEKLVDLCHIVSSMDINGVLVDNAYEYSLNVIGDYIIAYLSNEKVANGQKNISMRANHANFEADLDMMNPDYGYSQNYVIIGSANGEIPTSQMATYLASKLFNNMTISTEEPSDADIASFIDDVNMSDSRIKLVENKLSKKANWTQVSEDVVKQYYQQLVQYKNSDRKPKYVIDPTEDSLERRRSVLQENRRNMSREIMSYIPEAGATSIPAIIFGKLVEIINNPGKGPYYACGILNKAGKSLDHAIEARETYYRERKEKARNQQVIFEEEEPRVKNLLDDTGLLGINKNKRIKEYTNVLNNIYHWEAEGDRFEAMELLLRKIRTEVRKINENYIVKLRNTTNELLDTFKANTQYLTSENGDESTDGFTKQLVKFSKIQPKLDDELDQLNKSDETYELLKLLTNNPKVWMENNESQLKGIISNYINNKFIHILNKSMENFLREEFNLVKASDADFIDKIENETIIPLVNESAPRYWTNEDMVSNSIKTSHRYMLSLPNGASCIVKAGDKYANADSKIEIRKSFINDRIYILSTISGIPIHTYLGLIDYKDIYDGFNGKGLHMYERNIDWKKQLTFPYPYHLNSKYTKNAEELLKVYDEAVQKNVIEFDGTNAYINIKEELDKSLTDVDTLKIDGKISISLSQNRLQALHDYMNSIPSKKEEILSKGNRPNNRIIMDNFLRFFGVQEIVKKELEKLNTVENYIEKVEDIIRLENEKKELENRKIEKRKCYFDTIVTSGFEEEFVNLTYSYINIGREEKIILCDNTMPFSGLSKYYQGFINFLNINNVIYNELKEKTDAKFQEFNKNPADAQAKVEKLLKVYDPVMLANISEFYDGRAEKEDINIFYQEFIKYLNSLDVQLRMINM